MLYMTPTKNMLVQETSHIQELAGYSLIPLGLRLSSPTRLLGG